MNTEPIRSLWNAADAAKHPGDLGQRVYTSRLLGRDKSLVLHGGGNTSVKTTTRNVLGEEQETIFVKGSGWDLATIEEAGFTPLPVDYLRRLGELPALSDTQMAAELATHTLRAGAPAPSVETILHALLPWKYVDHTHADAFIAVSNTPDGSRRVREIYGDLVVYIPYVMPGFDLARQCAQIFPRDRTSRTIGMVLEHHGLFSFGDTARESYERMIELVRRAEDYLRERKCGPAGGDSAPASTPVDARRLASLRRDVSRIAGFPVIVSTQRTPDIDRFVHRPDLAVLAGQGPATPDHSIRTKRVPLVGTDVAAYAREYRDYFEANTRRSPKPLVMLDPAPRVILDPELGLAAIGRTAGDAAIVAEIYTHTIEIVTRAAALGGWQSLSAAEIFDVEYWELEQAKLRQKGVRPPLVGEVAIVTGAASGIGRACVAVLLQRGAAVVGLDLNPGVASLHDHAGYFGLICDLTNEDALKKALDESVRRFGGIDLLVLNAGIFPPGTPIGGLATEQWRRVLQINLDASFILLREAHPFLKLAPRGGRVVVIGSKNVPAPGPGAAAYSASKAALNQLARVAALEWGADNIRINSLHPNAVFDTGLWTPEKIAARAQSYGLTVEQYKTNNVLRTEITSRDVAELAAEMCGPLFAKTTGAQVPIDGGNDRVI